MSITTNSKLPDKCHRCNCDIFYDDRISHHTKDCIDEFNRNLQIPNAYIFKANKWIKWEGENPYKNLKEDEYIEWVFDGNEILPEVEYVESWPRWEHYNASNQGEECDVTHYMIGKIPKPPRDL